MIDSDRSP